MDSGSVSGKAWEWSKTIAFWFAKGFLFLLTLGFVGINEARNLIDDKDIRVVIGFVVTTITIVIHIFLSVVLLFNPEFEITSTVNYGGCDLPPGYAFNAFDTKVCQKNTYLRDLPEESGGDSWLQLYRLEMSIIAIPLLYFVFYFTFIVFFSEKYADVHGRKVALVAFILECTLLLCGLIALDNMKKLVDLDVFKDRTTDGIGRNTAWAVVGTSAIRVGTIGIMYTSKLVNEGLLNSANDRFGNYDQLKYSKP